MSTTGGVLLATCCAVAVAAETECGLKRSARSRSMESMLNEVSAISGCSSASMMMTALSAFNHWPFRESPSRMAFRTRSSRWVVDRSNAEAFMSHSFWGWWVYVWVLVLVL